MVTGSFYTENRDAALYLLKELSEGLATPIRIAYNDAFEYVILNIHPPALFAFFGMEYFITIRMEQEFFRLGYADDQGQLQAEFFPDLVMLRDRLEEMKPDLNEMIQRWEDDLEEMIKEVL